MVTIGLWHGWLSQFNTNLCLYYTSLKFQTNESLSLSLQAKESKMKALSPSSSNRKSNHATPSFSFYIIAITFIVFMSILYGEDFSCIVRQSFLKSQQSEEEPEQQQPEKQPSHGKKSRNSLLIYFVVHPCTDLESIMVVEKLPFAVGRTGEGCNVFEGRWVYDEEARPLYQEEDCPYIQPQLTCQKYGRPDTGYQHWRWQPHGCSLPRYPQIFIRKNDNGSFIWIEHI